MKLQITIPQTDQVKFVHVRVREEIPEVAEEFCSKYDIREREQMTVLLQQQFDEKNIKKRQKLKKALEKHLKIDNSAEVNKKAQQPRQYPRPSTNKIKQEFQQNENPFQPLVPSPTIIRPNKSLFYQRGPQLQVRQNIVEQEVIFEDVEVSITNSNINTNRSASDKFQEVASGVDLNFMQAKIERPPSHSKNKFTMHQVQNDASQSYMISPSCIERVHGHADAARDATSEKKQLEFDDLFLPEKVEICSLDVLNMMLCHNIIQNDAPMFAVQYKKLLYELQFLKDKAKIEKKNAADQEKLQKGERLHKLFQPNFKQLVSQQGSKDIFQMMVLGFQTSIRMLKWSLSQNFMLNAKIRLKSYRLERLDVELLIKNRQYELISMIIEGNNNTLTLGNKFCNQIDSHLEDQDPLLHLNKVKEEQKSTSEPQKQSEKHIPDVESIAESDFVSQFLYQPVPDKKNGCVNAFNNVVNNFAGMKDKYIEFSDFIEYLFQNPINFIKKTYEVKKTDGQIIDPKIMDLQIINQFAKELVINCQQGQCKIDFGDTTKTFLEYGKEQILIEDLIENQELVNVYKAFKPQTKDSLNKSYESDDNNTDGNFPQFCSKKKLNHFHREEFIVHLILQSTQLEMYSTAFVVSQIFHSDITKIQQLPIFEMFFKHFQDSNTKYDLKLALLVQLKPLMCKKMAEEFCKIIENKLKLPAHNNIFSRNINPLRVGLMLYKVISDLKIEFQLQELMTDKLLEYLNDKLIHLVNSYTDSKDLLFLLLQRDFDGNNAFWYFDEFEMFEIMRCQIMDTIIRDTWMGHISINSQILDSSTSYSVLFDKYKLFTSNNIFKEIMHTMLEYDFREKTHIFKFHNWIHSSHLRFHIEAMFHILLAFISQWYISLYIPKFHESRHHFNQIYYEVKQYGINEENRIDVTKVWDSFEEPAKLLYQAGFFLILNLMFPIDIFYKWYFYNITFLKGDLFTVFSMIDVILCILTAGWIFIEQFMNGIKEENEFTSGKMAQFAQNRTKDEIFMCNIIYYHSQQYRVDLYLSLICGFMWIKTLFIFRGFKAFGPMYKVMMAMIIELVRFLAIWAIEILMFSFVGRLAFSEIPSFDSLGNVILMYFESCLGSWNIKIYDDCKFPALGYIYHCIFLVLNLILCLNLVIAMLCSTFAQYESKQLGLYYEVIVAKFPEYGYNQYYGFLVCAQPPGNIMILPFVWIVFFIKDEKKLKIFNKVLCHILYIPFLILVCIFYTFLNALILPFAYVVQEYRLFISIFYQENLKEAAYMVKTLLIFTIFGPIILTLSLIPNLVILIINLYTEPTLMQEDIPKHQLMTKFGLTQIKKCLEKYKKKIKIIQKIQCQQKLRNQVPMSSFINDLREEMNVIGEIKEILFTHDNAKKFTKNKDTGRQVIRPQVLHGLKEFCQYKLFICENQVLNSSTTNSKGNESPEIDIEFLDQLINQQEQKAQIMMIQKKFGNILMSQSEDEFLQEALYEMTIHSSTHIIKSFQSDNDVLERIKAHLIYISEKFDTFEDKMDQLDNCCQLVTDIRMNHEGIITKPGNNSLKIIKKDLHRSRRSGQDQELELQEQIMDSSTLRKHRTRF